MHRGFPPIRGLAVFIWALACTFSLLPPASSEPLEEAAPSLARPENHPLHSAVVFDNIIFAVGTRGVVLQNQGAGWQQIDSPVRRSLTSIFATEDGRLFALGHDALIISMSSKNSDWQIVRHDIDFDAPLLDAWIEPDGNSLAVGAYGLALATEDYGRSWSQQDIDLDEPHFNAIVNTSDGDWFLVGEFGTVLKSRDKG